MKLSKPDADLFFELMWPLQFFVKQRLKLLPSVTTLAEYVTCPTAEKTKIRDALYANKHLIDPFVRQNPENLPPDKLLAVSKWKDCIEGDFYIERFLKKQAIFITNDRRVYGVSGLFQGFDEMIDPSNLPLMVQTVLLPFLGKIVYDGVLKPFNIHFGGGVRSDLKEAYMVAKQNNRIIESLEAQTPATQAKPQALKDWAPEIDDLCARAKSLKAGANYPFTYGAAFALVKASLEFAQAVVSPLEAVERPYFKTLNKVQRELDKAITIINREEK